MSRTRLVMNGVRGSPLEVLSRSGSGPARKQLLYGGDRLDEALPRITSKQAIRTLLKIKLPDELRVHPAPDLFAVADFIGRKGRLDIGEQVEVGRSMLRGYGFYLG